MKNIKQALILTLKILNGEYPLINALYQEQNEITKYLIEHGGDCNVKNNRGIPLLVFVIQNENDNIVKHILKKPNIHINEKSENGYSAFMTAINQNNTGLVELILNYSNNNNIPIDINEKDASGNYPIAKAINKNNFDMVILLMEYGMNNKIDMNNLTNINDYSLLYLAYKQKNLRMFKYLSKHLDVNQIDNTGQSIIFTVVVENDIDIVEYLIYNGANLSIKDKYNNSFKQQYTNLILNFLIKKHNMEAIKYLIESEKHKANLEINVKYINDEYPLINALYQEQNEIIKYLIEHGGDCNIKNNHGIPLLVLAIQKNNDEIAKYILEKPGIHINEKCPNGYSAS